MSNVSRVGSAIVLLLAIAGCQPSRPTARRGATFGGSEDVQSAGPVQTKEPVAPISNTDPCATRLHDICEPLLLYYLSHHELPQRLEDLRELPGFENLVLSCPVSNRPYQYNPVGVITSDNQPRLIIYDPAPSHSGFRWAVAIIEPKDNGALVTKVVAVPEARFTLKLSR